MEKQVYLKFENDEKLSAFLNLVSPFQNKCYTTYSTVGSNFSQEEIKIAIEDFGATVVENLRS